jgi:hypothetical protein
VCGGGENNKGRPRWVTVLRTPISSLLFVLHPQVALSRASQWTALQLTWSLTPHPPAGNVPVFRTASASLHPAPSVGTTGGQDLLLSRTMLSTALLTLENQASSAPHLTWVVSPATGIDLQPQTWRATHEAPYTHTPRSCRALSEDTFLKLRSPHVARLIGSCSPTVHKSALGLLAWPQR